MRVLRREGGRKERGEIDRGKRRGNKQGEGGKRWDVILPPACPSACLSAHLLGCVITSARREKMGMVKMVFEKGRKERKKER